MIKDLTISEVYNAANEKTIEISIKTNKGKFSACAPSGTSAGSYEAKILDVRTIIKNFTKLKESFIGKNEESVDKIIEELGIEKIGANLSIVLSIAAIRSLSKNDVYKYLNKDAHVFPFPLGNVIGGGAHKGFTSEQEFLVLPVEAQSIEEAVETNKNVWKEVGRFAQEGEITSGNNLEGAWICKLDDIKTLDILSKIAEEHGAKVGIDFAATQMYKNGKYCYINPKRKLTPEKQLDFVLELIKTYDLVYVEDPFNENDFNHFSELVKKTKCMVVGDDLFATQPERLKIGIKKKAANSLIIKPDQTGTVSRVLETVSMAKKAGYKTVVSHRSRDTLDSFVSDLAVGIESPVIKCGIIGKEREAKLERLVKIWSKVKEPEMAKLVFL